METSRQNFISLSKYLKEVHPRFMSIKLLVRYSKRRGDSTRLKIMVYFKGGDMFFRFRAGSLFAHVFPYNEHQGKTFVIFSRKKTTNLEIFECFLEASM